MRRWDTVEAFRADDPRRAGPAEVEFGSLWLDGTEATPWRVCWLEGTGELIAVRRGIDGDGPVELLATVPSRPQVERALRGWWQMCGHRGSLPWIRHRAEEAADW